MSFPSTRARRLKTPSITRSPRSMALGSARTTSWNPLTVASTASCSWAISNSSFTNRSSLEGDGEFVVEFGLFVQGVHALVKPAKCDDAQTAESDEILLQSLERRRLDVEIDGRLKNAAPRADPQFAITRVGVVLVGGGVATVGDVERGAGTLPGRDRPAPRRAPRSPSSRRSPCPRERDSRCHSLEP